MRDLLIPKPFLPEMRGEESTQCNADSDSRLEYSGALLIKIEDLAPESYLYYPSLEDLEADLDYLAQLFILPGSSESRPKGKMHLHKYDESDPQHIEYKEKAYIVIVSNKTQKPLGIYRTAKEVYDHCKSMNTGGTIIHLNELDDLQLSYPRRKKLLREVNLLLRKKSKLE